MMGPLFVHGDCNSANGQILDFMSINTIDISAMLSPFNYHDIITSHATICTSVNKGSFLLVSMMFTNIIKITLWTLAV